MKKNKIAEVKNYLLKDIRYKLISDYPNSTFKVGTIFTKILNDTFSFEVDNIKYTAFLNDIDKYPNIFQKLD